MYVFGGTRDYQQTFSQLHCLNLDTWVWDKVVPAGALQPPGCFSHSLTAVGDLLVLAGGCHTLGAGTRSPPFITGWSHQWLASCSPSFVTSVLINLIVSFDVEFDGCVPAWSPAAAAAKYMLHCSYSFLLHMLIAHQEVGAACGSASAASLPGITDSSIPAFCHAAHVALPSSVHIVLQPPSGKVPFAADHVHTFHPGSACWSRHAALDSRDLVLCRHTATAAPDQKSLMLLGGGMNCFGFGTTFSPPVQLNLAGLVSRPSRSAHAAPLAQQGAVSSSPGAHRAAEQPHESARHRPTENAAVNDHNSIIGTCTAQATNSTLRAVSSGGSGRSQPQSLHRELGTGGGEQRSAGDGMGLAVSKRQAKQAKDALKALGWLDPSLKSTTTADTVCLPLSHKGVTLLPRLQVPPLQLGSQVTARGSSLDQAGSAAGAGAVLKAQAWCWEPQADGLPSESGTDGDQPTANGRVSGAQIIPNGIGKGKGGVTSNAGVAAFRGSLAGLMQQGVAGLQPMQAQPSSRHRQAAGPAARLKAAVHQLLQQQVPAPSATCHGSPDKVACLSMTSFHGGGFEIYCQTVSVCALTSTGLLRTAVCAPWLTLFGCCIQQTPDANIPIISVSADGHFEQMPFVYQAGKHAERSWMRCLLRRDLARSAQLSCWLSCQQSGRSWGILPCCPAHACPARIGAVWDSLCGGQSQMPLV